MQWIILYIQPHSQPHHYQCRWMLCVTYNTVGSGIREIEKAFKRLWTALIWLISFDQDQHLFGANGRDAATIKKKHINIISINPHVELHKIASGIWKEIWSNLFTMQFEPNNRKTSVNIWWSQDYIKSICFTFDSSLYTINVYIFYCFFLRYILCMEDKRR